MTQGLSSRLSSLPRALRRRSRLAREERFSPAFAYDPAAPALLLSPHWDDAVLSCWATLAPAAPLTVVNVFAGLPEPGARGAWEAVLGVADASERARVRLAEDARGLALAGREAVNLPLLDSRYRGGSDALGLAAIDAALCAASSGASRIHAPAGIGAHRDHLLVRRYALALMRAGMPVTLYAELPYCVLHGWPAWVDGAAREPDRDADAYWQSFLRGVPAMPALREAAVVRLSAGDAAVKREAIALYRASLSHSVRATLASPSVHGFEVSWPLS